MPSTSPKPPVGASAAGRELWRSELAGHDLTAPELALLTEIVRCMTQLDELDKMVRADGVTVDSPQGVRAHPALTESRQQRIVLARLTVALRLQTDADEELRRVPRRGFRGMYVPSARPDRVTHLDRMLARSMQAEGGPVALPALERARLRAEEGASAS